VELNFSLNFGCNGLLGEDIGEIVGKLIRVNLLDLASRQLNHSGEALDVCFGALDRDKVDHHAVLLGKESDLVIEGHGALILTASIPVHVEGTEANIRHTVSADDNLRSWGTLRGHGD
jgi:hypothetical protein